MCLPSKFISRFLHPHAAATVPAGIALFIPYITAEPHNEVDAATTAVFSKVSTLKLSFHILEQFWIPISLCFDNHIYASIRTKLCFRNHCVNVNVGKLPPPDLDFPIYDDPPVLNVGVQMTTDIVRELLFGLRPKCAPIDIPKISRGREFVFEFCLKPIE